MKIENSYTTSKLQRKKMKSNVGDAVAYRTWDSTVYLFYFHATGNYPILFDWKKYTFSNAVAVGRKWTQQKMGEKTTVDKQKTCVLIICEAFLVLFISGYLFWMTIDKSHIVPPILTEVIYQANELINTTHSGWDRLNLLWRHKTQTYQSSHR